MTPTEAHALARSQGMLAIWTIYDKPSDYPSGVIARMHVVMKDGSSGVTTATISGATLNEVRQKLPPGLTCLGREACDEPQIVESWI